MGEAAVKAVALEMVALEGAGRGVTESSPLKPCCLQQLTRSQSGAVETPQAVQETSLEEMETPQYLAHLHQPVAGVGAMDKTVLKLGEMVVLEVAQGI